MTYEFMHKKVHVFSLIGDLNLNNVNLVQNNLKTKVGDFDIDSPKLLFNLKDLNYLDSSGIGLLVFAYHNVKERKGDMVLSQVRPSVGRLIDMTGLDNFFMRYDSNKEAIDYLLK